MAKNNTSENLNSTREQLVKIKLNADKRGKSKLHAATL
jgi:hypothetical protein